VTPPRVVDVRNCLRVGFIRDACLISPTHDLERQPLGKNKQEGQELRRFLGSTKKLLNS
jgi:hypothetical protein